MHRRSDGTGSTANLWNYASQLGVPTKNGPPTDA